MTLIGHMRRNQIAFGDLVEYGALVTTWRLLCTPSISLKDE